MLFQRFALTDWLESLLRKLSACWRDPSASVELAAMHLARQYHAVVRQLPLSSLGNLITSLIISLIFWNDTDSTIMLIWASLLWAIGLANIGLWWRCRSVSNASPVSGLAVWLITLIPGRDNFKHKLDHLPWIIFVITLISILTRPLGPAVQRKVSTNANVGRMKVSSIMIYTDRGRWFQHVVTRH